MAPLMYTSPGYAQLVCCTTSLLISDYTYACNVIIIKLTGINSLILYRVSGKVCPSDTEYFRNV